MEGLLFLGTRSFLTERYPPCPLPEGRGEFQWGIFRGECPEKFPPEKFPAPGAGLGVGGFHYLINFLNYNWEGGNTRSAGFQVR